MNGSAVLQEAAKQALEVVTAAGGDRLQLRDIDLTVSKDLRLEPVPEFDGGIRISSLGPNSAMRVAAILDKMDEASRRSYP